MPARTHHTALVIVPPEEVWEPIQAIRRRYDRRVRRWMPHINLLYPFRPVTDFGALATVFAEASRELVSFDLTLRSLRHFRHRDSSATVWLKPEPGEALTELRHRLGRLVPDCLADDRRGGEFVPHLSLGQARDSRELHALERYIAEVWTPLTFRVDAVFMIARGDPPVDVFRVATRIPLGPP